MQEDRLISSSLELNAAIGQLGCEVKIVGTQRFSREVLLVKAGGSSTERAPILITAGAHTDEPAGILAAYQLIQEIESTHPVYIIPGRDPLVFDGLRRSLQLEIGSEEPLGDWQHLQATLMEKGEVLHHADDLMIAIVGETVFAVYPPRRNAATYFSQKLWPNVIKQSPEIIEKMKMRRFMLPGDRLCFEDWDVFGPASATRYIIEEGKMRCPDTVIGTIPPPLPAEVEGILAAIDELKPVMTLDLHEGGSDGFFMFADSPTSDLEVSVAHAMSAAVSANGGKVTPPDEIIAYWIEHFGEAVPKMYTHIGASTWSKAWEGRTLGGYVRKYGGIIVPETGRELPLAKRIEMQICAALGAIEAVENQD